MEKTCKKVLDQLDDLMIALTKQKKLGLDPAVIIALKNLTRTRNSLKREYIKNQAPKVATNVTSFTEFLDKVAGAT